MRELPILMNAKVPCEMSVNLRCPIGGVGRANCIADLPVESEARSLNPIRVHYCHRRKIDGPPVPHPEYTDRPSHGFIRRHGFTFVPKKILLAVNLHRTWEHKHRYFPILMNGAMVQTSGAVDKREDLPAIVIADYRVCPISLAGVR
jgi:hypothetical protein